uniref:Cortactin-binding protein-2 N-terminal domain-containing protein n=1 Tax=Ciona savignyi TaxID=51511 RepID=H2YF32_CIOSA
NINLSRDELLKLLSVFEGELQARDEVISILKTECSQNTETRYGLTNQPLKALQRDAASLDMTPDTLDCVQTKDQLRKIIQHQKDSYKRLKHILMTSEDKYKRMGVELEGEKKKHQEYMTKSDDFVNLLEHDRERLKQILEREKVTHDRKERELVRKLRENKDELSRLKSLSLELVEDRQRQLQNFNEQRQLVATQQKTCEELQAKLEELESTNSSEKEHSLQLENELEEQTNKFYRENEELTSKLSAQEEKNAQLEDKITSMNKQIRKLKNVDKNFRKTDDQLFKIREKLEQEERHEDLLVEVELLRKTVEEMREAEEVYAQVSSDCRDVKSALEAELDATRLMRSEIEKLRKNAKNQKEMERCIEESNFRFDEIKSQFDAEAKKAEKMRKKLEEYEEQIARLNEFETALKSGEIKLKQCHQVIKELKDER